MRRVFPPRQDMQEYFRSGNRHGSLFFPSFRPYCEENLCGQYGANYSCPPDCGTPEEMKQKVLAHKKALVLQSIWQLESYTDTPAIKKGKSGHNTAAIRRYPPLRRRKSLPHRHTVPFVLLSYCITPFLGSMALSIAHSDQIRNILNQANCFLPAETGVGDGLAVNAVADLLAAGL